MKKDLSFDNILTTKRARTPISSSAGNTMNSSGSGGSSQEGKGSQERKKQKSSGGFGGGGSSGPGNGKEAGGASSEPMDPYLIWKKNIPILYDSLVYHNLSWASLTCAFGMQANPVVEEFHRRQTIFFSSRTTAMYNAATNEWTSKVNVGELYFGSMDVPLPNTMRRKQITRIGHKSARINIHKKIIHPGEVNRVRASPRMENVIATHCDSPNVYIWDLNKQPDRTVGKKTSESNPTKPSVASIPDLTLVGHKDIAEYALCFSKTTDDIISGGMDRNVCLWNIGDSESGSAAKLRAGPSKLMPRAVFQGHLRVVEGCEFDPKGEGRVCCSVGRDRYLAFWDTRYGFKPSIFTKSCHTDDINCVSWNPHDNNYVLTGGSDKLICLWDIRKMQNTSLLTAKPVFKFSGDESVILNVAWSPHMKNFFASTSENSNLLLWELNNKSGDNTKFGKQDPQLFFNHAGHRAPVCDFDWNPVEPWSFMSVSDDGRNSNINGGGSLQFWRITDLLTRQNDQEYIDMIEEKAAHLL